ncbi:MAG: hypothetical protein HND52_20250, partial [Ignavibacteriae bacterium]|nr:hypothetical protein [Ignavibacteriota bacterium]NOH00303.1 hypothetical protein [Ignavibacteriota bacterium]
TKDIPRKLNKENINKAIEDYLELLRDIPLNISANNILQLLTDLKRKELNAGPYPDVTLFEAANRIMTDLVILFGVKKLLNGCISEINFDEYEVEFGHENFNDNDIKAFDGRIELIGEAFNVAKTFFQPKKNKTLKKMRQQQKNNEKLLLIYNADAVNKNYVAKPRENEYHLQVKIEFD